ncbi:MAG: hypothetical protein IPJ41_01720 [Phycisphaerales bacterium]|nr:hypothetical protein [Phycisphaerales bacterium]
MRRTPNLLAGLTALSALAALIWLQSSRGSRAAKPPPPVAAHPPTTAPPSPGAERTKTALERATARYDTDGDGRLSADEWTARHAALVQQAADNLFLLHYDLDHSARVDPAEVNTFLDWYRAGSLRADVNGDALVNALDLQAMMEAYQRQPR